MNNEEKILTTLEQIQSKVEHIESKVEHIESKMDHMGAKMERMECDIADLKEFNQVTRRFQIRVESEYRQRIAVALDGVIGSNEKNMEQDKRILSLESKSENHSSRISLLEYAAKAL